MIDNKVLKTKACGKVVVFGEYGVLIGLPAYVAAVDKFATCTFNPGTRITLTSKTTAKNKLDKSLLSAVCFASPILSIPIKKGRYFIDTSSFFDHKKHSKIGLGSSSAAIVAFCKAILKNSNLLTPKKLFCFSFFVNQLLSNQKSSGIDIAASCNHGLIWFVKDQKAIRTKIVPKDLTRLIWSNLNVVHLKKAHPTQPAVENFLKFAQQKDVVELLEKNDQVIKNFFNVNPNFSKLIDTIHTIDRNFNELEQITNLGIITEEHLEVSKLAATLGGAAKISGAGGGDISLVAVPENNKAQLYQEIAKLGFEILPLKLCS